MSDADGDSTMHSSPRSSVSDDLFPGADVSSTAATAGSGINGGGIQIVGGSGSGGGGGVPVPSTPAANIIKTAELSPPNSQGAPGLGGSGGAGGAAGVPDAATTINANGKRVYHTANTGAALEAKGKGGAVDNGAGSSSASAMDTNTSNTSNTTIFDNGGVSISPDASSNSTSKPVAPSVHAASGYRWEREADAPGWAWKNKKAQEDWYKAEDTFVDRDRMVQARYGDPLEGGGIAAAGSVQG